MMKMMGKMKEVQEKIKIAQDQLVNIEVEAESGAGMVVAKANGNKEIIQLTIDPSLFNEADKDLITDLIIAATNKAVKEADQKAKAHIQSATQGMMPNIPGLDLSGLG